MPKVIRFLSVVMVFILSSCKDECGECLSPPTAFIFELVNDQFENVFASGTFDPAQFRVVNTAGGQVFHFQWNMENDLNLIEINTIGWNTEEVVLSFQLDKREIFTFYVDAVRRNEGCCSFTSYNQITIEGASFELNNQTGIYSIVVD